MAKPGASAPSGHPHRRRRLRRPLHRAAAAAEAEPRAGRDHRRRPPAAHDLPAVPARGGGRLGRAAARRRAAAPHPAALPGDHRRGHRAEPRGEAGADRAGRGPAVRALLRRPRGGAPGRSRARCRSPGWPSTASASRPSARPSTCATTCWPGWTPPAPPTTRRCGSGRSPSSSSAAATPASRRSPSSRTWRATPSSATTRGCRSRTCAGSSSRRPAGSCPRSARTWRAYTVEQLLRRGMDVKLNTRLESISDGGVVSSATARSSPATPSSGRRASSRTRCWRRPTCRSTSAAGSLRGDPAGARACPTRGPRATAPPCPTSPRRPGATTAPNAQHAVRQAKLLADNIVAGAPRRASRCPTGTSTSGSVASLGLYKGVAQVYGVKLRGFPAWFMHRTYHVSRVPTFNRKVRVVADWTLALFFRREVVSLGQLQDPRREFVFAANTGKPGQLPPPRRRRRPTRPPAPRCTRPSGWCQAADRGSPPSALWRRRVL